jgi:hypothetical protein
MALNDDILIFVSDAQTRVGNLAWEIYELNHKGHNKRKLIADKVKIVKRLTYAIQTVYNINYTIVDSDGNTKYNFLYDKTDFEVKSFMSKIRGICGVKSYPYGTFVSSVINITSAIIGGSVSVGGSDVVVSDDVTLGGASPSHTKVPTQFAVKTYADNGFIKTSGETNLLGAVIIDANENIFEIYSNLSSYSRTLYSQGDSYITTRWMPSSGTTYWEYGLGSNFSGSGDTGAGMKYITPTAKSFVVTTAAGTVIGDEHSSLGAYYDANYGTAGRANNRWLPDWQNVRDYHWKLDANSTLGSAANYTVTLPSGHNFKLGGANTFTDTGVGIYLDNNTSSSRVTRTIATDSSYYAQQENQVSSSSQYSALTVRGASGQPSSFAVYDGGNTYVSRLTSTVPGSSGNKYILDISPNITQSGSASYYLLNLMPTETSVGSGPNYLIRAGFGGSVNFTLNPDGSFWTKEHMDLTAGTAPSAPGAGLGRLYVDSSDNHIYFKSTSGTYDLTSAGSTTTFLDLTDSPSGYSGAASDLVRVNATADALEFVDGTTIFAQVSHTHTSGDIPADVVYSSKANTYTVGKQTFIATTTSNASVNLPHGSSPSAPADGDMWTTTGGVFARVNGSTVDLSTGGVGSWIDLSDTDPANYTGSGGYLVRVNATPDGLEFVDGSTLYAPLSHTHTSGDIPADVVYTSKANTFTVGKQTFVATSTSYASVNIPHGTAPSSPANGDLWTTTTGMFARINGSTYNISQGSPGGSNTQFQYNNASTFGGTTEFTYNNSTGLITYNPTLDEATGDEIAFNITPTINKATSGNWTGLRINYNEIAAPGTDDRLVDLASGGGSVTWIKSNGDYCTTYSNKIFLNANDDSSVYLNSNSSGYFYVHVKDNGNPALMIRNEQFTIDSSTEVISSVAANSNFAYFNFGEFTNSSGVKTSFLDIRGTVNQTGTATGYNGILLDVTESSTVGSANTLIDLQVGSSSKFSISNSGALNLAAGVRQTFAPNTTTAGFNFGSVVGWPSSGSVGDAAYNSVTDAVGVYVKDSFKPVVTKVETTLTDGSSITGDCAKADDVYFKLETSQTTINPFYLDNVDGGTVVNVAVKKTIAGDCTITLDDTNTGLTFRGYDNAGYGTTPNVVLSGAANDFFDISILVTNHTDSGDNVCLVALGEKAN